MLAFWYSERCSRQIKFCAIVFTCTLILLCAERLKLAPLFSALSLGIGLLMHLLYLTLQTRQSMLAQPWRSIVQKMPYGLLVILFFCLPRTGNWADMLMQILQCLGFSALGLFLLSIYQNRAKRFD